MKIYFIYFQDLILQIWCLKLESLVWEYVWYAGIWLKFGVLDVCEYSRV